MRTLLVLAVLALAGLVALLLGSPDRAAEAVERNPGAGRAAATQEDASLAALEAGVSPGGDAAQPREEIAPPERAPGDPSLAPRPFELLVLGARTGTPIEGARIRGPSTSGRRFDRRSRTRTDRRGVAKLEVRPYADLSIDAPGHTPTTWKLERGDRSRSATVVLNEHAALHGRVPWAAEGDEVIVEGQGLPRVSSRIDSHGRWRAPDLVIESAHVAATGVAVSLHAKSSQITLARDLVVRPGDDREIHARAARWTDTELRLRYPDGSAPVHPVWVTAETRDPSLPSAKWWGFTSADGSVTLKRVAVGSHRVSVSSSQGLGGVVLEGVEIREGEPVEIVLEGRTVIEGHVDVPTDAPDMELELKVAWKQSDGSDASTIAALDPGFRIELADPGQAYTVQVRERRSAAAGQGRLSIAELEHMVSSGGANVEELDLEGSYALGLSLEGPPTKILTGVEVVVPYPREWLRLFRGR